MPCSVKTALDVSIATRLYSLMDGSGLGCSQLQFWHTMPWGRPPQHLRFKPFLLLSLRPPKKAEPQINADGYVRFTSFLFVTECGVINKHRLTLNNSWTACQGDNDGARPQGLAMTSGAYDAPTIPGTGGNQPTAWARAVSRTTTP